MTKLSLAAFEELVRRFPRGTFARDGQLKIDLTKSHLAGKEMAVGRFYLERKQYTAAIRRFDIVIQIYPTTNQVPEALYRTAEAYYALGLSDQSERLYQVAQYNYSESVWTERLASLRADPEQSPEKGMFKRSINVITNKFF
jgi:outer membrane protein assembly factor BamD